MLVKKKGAEPLWNYVNVFLVVRSCFLVLPEKRFFCTCLSVLLQKYEFSVMKSIEMKSSLSLI